MTTVERYRPTHPFPSDALSNGRRSHPSSTTIANVPPAVPSPPRLSRNSPPQKPHIQAIPSPIFEMAHDGSSQWLFTDAEILSTPSILHGYPPEQERCYRAKGSNFILQAAILLKLPQLTIATASTFFHRFYMRASMDQNKGGYHHYVGLQCKPPLAGPSVLPSIPWKLPRSRSFAAKDPQTQLTSESCLQTIAGTALFLASKTEETCRKTREIVVACAKVAQKNSNLVIDEQSKEYWRWRDNILLYEEMMLEYLTFDLVLDSPYNLLYGFLQRLHIEENKRLRNVAWSFLNDSCHTTICLAIPAKDIAIAAIYFGAKFNRDTISDDENGNPWWEQLGGSPKRIVKGVAILAEFWTENPLRRSENPYEQSPMFLSNEDEVHRSRRRGDIGSGEDTPSPGQQSQPMQNGDSQQSHAESNRAINGNEDSQPRMNGRERLVNGAGSEMKERPSPKANGEQKDDLTMKTIENGSGASDTLLKEVANDPGTHEPDELKRSTQKRKSDEDVERSPLKRSKTDPDAIISAGQSDDYSRGNAAGRIAGVTNGTKPKDDEEESEEGELDE
ncbi:cyclin-like protein [Tricladium varicosporioides]|nr:cyclin-like protein [Hymenoscyphus varicosporioides]